MALGTRYRLRVGWNGRNSGVFRIGMGGTSIIAPDLPTYYRNTVLASNPVSYWRLGEPSGVAAADYKGVAPGVYQNTPTLGVAGALAADADTGITLDGVNEFVSVAHVAALNVGDDFTIEMWVKPGALAGTRNLFVKGSGPGRLTMNVSRQIILSAGAGVVVVTSTSAVPNDGVWHHCMATKDGAVSKLYIDGVDVTGAVVNTTATNNGSALAIGASSGGGNYFPGSIDEVALYDSALTADDALAHYTAGITAVLDLALYDRIGYAFTPSYTGPYNDLSQEAMYMATDFTVTRGRSDPNGNIVAGRLEVKVADKWPGRFNPLNTASPLYGKIRPMRPCHLEGSSDNGATWQDIIHGWLDEEESDPDRGHNEARFVFRDFLMWLELPNVNLVIPDTGPIYVGAAIGMILDAYGWTNPALRSLDNGTLLPTFSSDGSKTGLQLISEILAVDLGTFFHARDNVVTYNSRYRRVTQTSFATFTETVTQMPGVALSWVKNAIKVSKGATSVLYFDAASDQEFGPRGHSSVDSDYFPDLSYMESYARYRVNQTKEPRIPVWTTEVQQGPTGYHELLLQADLSKRLTIDLPDLPSKDYFIEQVIHSGKAGELHKTKFILSEVPLGLPFIVGDSSSKIAPSADAEDYNWIAF